MNFESFLNNSLLMIFFSLLFSTYGLYLSWRQAQVKDQMTELISIAKNIDLKMEEKVR